MISDLAHSVRPVVLYDGGNPPTMMAAACDVAGLEVLPYVECMPLGAGRPHLLAGPASPWRLSLGLSADFSGFVETASDGSDDPRNVWSECAFAVSRGGIALSLSSATTYSHDVPGPFIAAVRHRHPGTACLEAMEMVLYEAVANALIHGNLGIDSTLRGSAADLRNYRTTLAHALTNPERARRRVTITCHPAGNRLRLTVRDQGEGWDVASAMRTAAAADAKSGRGLDLIRRMTTAITAEDDGRRLIMDFVRD